MAAYQDKARDRIKIGLRRMQTIVQKGKDEDFKEADTRKIVSDILTQYLGWDQFENLTSEQMIGSRYADYVIKKDGDEIAVVEVKQINLKLKETHLNQARQYATDEGIEWMILTNGDMWKVYRNVLEDKIPVAKLVFTISISGSEMKPAQKADLFYYLSKESYKKHEIEDYYQRRIALSGQNLASYILSDSVMDKIRLSIKSCTGQKLDNSEIAEAMVARLFQPELKIDDWDKAIARMKRAESTPRKKRDADGSIVEEAE